MSVHQTSWEGAKRQINTPCQDVVIFRIAGHLGSQSRNSKANTRFIHQRRSRLQYPRGLGQPLKLSNYRLCRENHTSTCDDTDPAGRCAVAVACKVGDRRSFGPKGRGVVLRSREEHGERHDLLRLTLLAMPLGCPLLVAYLAT